MSLSIKITIKKTAPQLNYDVLIENQPDGTVKATLLGLPNYQSVGATEEEASNNLIHIIQQRKPKILTLEIEHTEEAENPLLKFAGMHKDNPLFDEVIAYIEEERNAIDAQVEESNAKFINEIEQALGTTTNKDIIWKYMYLSQRNQGVFTTNDEENNS